MSSTGNVCIFLAKILISSAFNFMNISLCNIIAIFVIAIAAASCSPGNQMHTAKMGSARLYDSVLVDKDGNKYAIEVLRDNKQWMTTNLKLNIPGSYCYDNTAENCEKYGRLYTWESAQKACSLLGKDWRLPAKEEWQQLAGIYGDSGADSFATRKKAFRELLFTGSSSFNAVLGGGRDQAGNYARMEAHGFYWTVTENDISTAWFANFAKGSQALYHQSDGEKERAFSVRCVRDIDTLK